MKPPVGLIGLGLMGHPMAANLLKAGHELTVWNRTASRGDDLVAQGAKRAATPREVAAASEVIITIVSDPPALESVLWGESGVFAGLRRGSVMIESSTVSPGLEKRAAAGSGSAGRGISGSAGDRRDVGRGKRRAGLHGGRRSEHAEARRAGAGRDGQEVVSPRAGRRGANGEAGDEFAARCCKSKRLPRRWHS